MAKYTLAIEVDEEAKAVKITHTEAGQPTQTYLLESLALFGGNAKTQELFIQMYGASADAAWAFAQGFRTAQGPEGGKGLKNFYKQSAAHICMAIDPDGFKNTVAADAIVNKWESTDQTKWGGWDTEDVLADKQISEARRAAAKCNCPSTDCAHKDRKKVAYLDASSIVEGNTVPFPSDDPKKGGPTWN
jgi:hypothetical protein